MAILTTGKEKIELLFKTATGYVKRLLSADYVVMNNGNTLEEEITQLNSKTEILSEENSYSDAAKQIGVTQEGKPIYRKTWHWKMTYFNKTDVGYAKCTFGLGVMIKQVLSIKNIVVKNSESVSYGLPYSGAGYFSTWFAEVRAGEEQSIIAYHNNIEWGDDYTLIATIDYIKN